MPSQPTFSTSKHVSTHVHEVTVSSVNYFDYLTILLPVVIPVLTFFLGYKLNRLYEKDREKERLVDVKNYFLTLAKTLQGSAALQTKEIQESIERIHNIAPHLSTNIISDLRTTRLKAIPDLDLYKVFITDRASIKNGIHYLNSTSSAIDFIDDAKIRLEQMNTNTAQLIDDYVKQYNILSSELADEVKRPKAHLSGNESNYYYTKLHNTYALVCKDYAAVAKVGDILNMHQNFIHPLYKLTRDIEENENTKKILWLILKLNGDYNNLSHSRKVAIDIYGDIANNLRSTGVQIGEIVTYLEGKSSIKKSSSSSLSLE